MIKIRESKRQEKGGGEKGKQHQKKKCNKYKIIIIMVDINPNL